LKSQENASYYCIIQRTQYVLVLIPRDNCVFLFFAWLCGSSTGCFAFGLYLVFIFGFLEICFQWTKKPIDDLKSPQDAKSTENCRNCPSQLQEIITLSLTQSRSRMAAGFLRSVVCCKMRFYLYLVFV